MRLNNRNRLGLAAFAAAVSLLSLVAFVFASDLSVTAGSVVSAEGSQRESGTAGATISAGQVIYKDASDSNKFKLCDSDSATVAARSPYGVALNGASSGQPLLVHTRGDINVGATLVVGKIYVASDTAGGWMPVEDLETGDFTTVLGIATTAANLKFFIIEGGVAVP